MQYMLVIFSFLNKIPFDHFLEIKAKGNLFQKELNIFVICNLILTKW